MIKISLFKQSEQYLLACSGGVDSIALFYLMLEQGINFSVATINYNFREESATEVENVQKICKDNNISFYLYNNTDTIDNNMEAKARNLRYNFFDEIIEEYNLDGLVTGHNLNDKLEWFLMQLTKGCGFNELVGMEEISSRNGYKLIKPLIETDRESIEEYIKNNNITSFYDQSNSELSYHPMDNPRGIKRNYFRHNFSNKLVKEFKTGIKKSFQIFEKERKYLTDKYEIEKLEDNCFLVKVDIEDDIMVSKSLDNLFKHQIKYLMSGDLRDEAITQLKSGIVINGYAVGIFNNNILVTKYIKKTKSKMSNDIKDFFRKHNIPIKNRAFLSTFDSLAFLPIQIYQSPNII